MPSKKIRKSSSVSAKKDSSSGKAGGRRKPPPSDDDNSDTNEDINERDDDSIDDDGSEVGWNSEDEMAFGSLFKKKKSTQSDSDKSDNDYSDDENDDDDEGLLLSDMLDKATKKTQGHSELTHEDGSSEDDSEESDEHGTEDSDSDDDYDEEGHNQLLSAIERYSKASDVNSSSGNGHGHIAQASAESTFSSLLDSSSTDAVSLDALLGALEDSGGLKAVKQRLSTLEKVASAPKYVHKAHSDRMERGLTYQSTSQEMAKWQQIVQENKHARSLDLAEDKRHLPSYKTLIQTFQPSTDMEKEVQMVLISSGQADERVAESQEQTALVGKQLTAEELRERHAALAKVKALLFYEQRKRNRINKIKSKTYHRILKRRKKRLEGGGKGDEHDLSDDELRQELNLQEGEGGVDEEEITKRIKERMDLRHKNTGKWARMAVKHGRVNKSLR